MVEKVVIKRNGEKRRTTKSELFESTLSARLLSGREMNLLGERCVCEIQSTFIYHFYWRVFVRALRCIRFRRNDVCCTVNSCSQHRPHMTEDANNKIQSVFESKIEEALKTKRKQNTLELSCLTLCLSSIYHHEHTNTNIEGLVVAAMATTATPIAYFNIISFYGIGLVRYELEVCFDNQCKHCRQTLTHSHSHHSMYTNPMQ